MTDHQAWRISNIVDLHGAQMLNREHRLLCEAEPCAIKLLLNVVSDQARRLTKVCDVAAEISDNVGQWKPRRGTSVDARKTSEALETIGSMLSAIVSSR